MGHNNPLLVPEYRFSGGQKGSRFDAGIEIVDVMNSASLESTSIDMEHIVSFFRGDPTRELVFSRLRRMLNRFDSTGTFRDLERESLIFHAGLRTLALLMERSPVATVFLTTPHTFGEYLLFESAKFLGIKTLFFQPVPVAPVMIPYHDLGIPQKPALASTEKTSVRGEIAARVADKLASLLDGAPPDYMISQRTRASKASGPYGKLRTLKHLVRWMSIPRFENSIDFSGMNGQSDFFTNFLRLYLNRGITRQLQRKASSLKRSVDAPQFALFALHYEPERTSLPEGLPAEFQLEAVLKVRAFLPRHHVLAVKEHSSQVSPSLRGHLGRSTRFYEVVSSLPNTVMLSPKFESSTRFQKISHVFTLTGTIALEAVASGVPVGYFGSPWWQGMPGTQRLDFNSLWDDFCSLRAPGREAVEEFVKEVLVSNCVPGIAGEDAHDYARRNGPISPELLREMTTSVAMEIGLLLSD